MPRSISRPVIQPQRRETKRFFSFLETPVDSRMNSSHYNRKHPNENGQIPMIKDAKNRGIEDWESRFERLEKLAMLQTSEKVNFIEPHLMLQQRREKNDDYGRLSVENVKELLQERKIPPSHSASSVLPGRRKINIRAYKMPRNRKQVLLKQ